MRKTHPNLKRGFRVPLVPLVPILGIATQLFIAGYMFFYSPRAWFSAAGWIVIGFAVYKLYASKTEEQALSVLALAETEAARKDYRVMVVPFRQEQVRPLMRLACALAKNYAGEVTAVSVVEVPQSVALTRYSGDLHESRTLLRLAEKIASEHDADFQRFIKISHRMSHGILETAREEKGNFILVGPLRKEGWTGQFREIVLLNVLEHAPCNVGIFRGESLVQVKRLLLAVEDTPSCRLAVNVAPALSAELDVPVALLHLVPSHASDREERDAAEWMEEITRDLPFKFPVERLVMPSGDVAGSIIEQVRDTDLLLMGASRYAGKLSSLFTSEVEERVMEGTGAPVLLLKRYRQQKSSRLSGILTGR
jgi:nucleotide-binding universal stress UspA family protein